MSRRLGLIVNPVAGLGGRVGLKGTDGREIVLRALELGAQPVAPVRADRALARLERHREGITIVAGARAMGGDAAREHGFETETVDVAEETSADDTRAAAAEMERRRVDLILYAGGDGTTRDIVDAVGTRVPILGIPTGVKMHSGVFATSPEAAGDLAASQFELGEAEVMDIDEEALRDGRVSAQLYAVARFRGTAGASSTRRQARAPATRGSRRSAASSPLRPAAASRSSVPARPRRESSATWASRARSSASMRSRTAARRPSI